MAFVGSAGVESALNSLHFAAVAVGDDEVGEGAAGVDAQTILVLHCPALPSRRRTAALAWR